MKWVRWQLLHDTAIQIRSHEVQLADHCPPDDYPAGARQHDND